MKIVSWNVNGIVSCRRKGFLKFLKDTRPDVVCCQEIKTQCELNTPGYLQFWNPAKRDGYSGTMTLTRRQPLSVAYGFEIKELNDEGRLLALEYEDCWIINVYVPSLHVYSAPDRPSYRADWDKAFRAFASKLKKPAILCGDFNVVLTELDVYPGREKGLEDQFGFQTEVRERFEQLLSDGYLDAFRTLYPAKEGIYSWWSPKNKNRIYNRGSRLDYFLVSRPLMNCVQNVRYHTENVASDHCPVSMIISPPKTQKSLSNEDLAMMWRSIDWKVMAEELAKKQKSLSLAAYDRDWSLVERLQKELVRSMAARVMAVKTVANKKSGPGVDGVIWKEPEEMMRAALSLNVRGYRPLPYLHKEIAATKENGEHRVVHLPVVRDRAMQALYRYSLDPVAEATSDRMSFSARHGRSALDLHAYLTRELEREGAPEIIVLADVQAFYHNAMHKWLIQNIPMDKTMLRKMLKAGVIRQGELFSTEQGISLGVSISPVLGNMILNGLQSRLYDRLYPGGGVEYSHGHLYRFSDDMAITAKNWIQADQIMQIISDFLQERGLRLNDEKARIVHISEGFNFVGRHYQKVNGMLVVTPSDKNIKQQERKLSNLILNFRGSQRSLIEAVNEMLTNWAKAQRSTDAYFAFRYIDSYVTGLMVRRLADKYKRWKPETIHRKFWVKSGGHYVFVLPDDPKVRIIQLAPTAAVRHKPCKSGFNPYLDTEYYHMLQYRREIQKHTGVYHSIWLRQGGKCAYCGQQMLPDQEIEVIEKHLGQGHTPRNLRFIHRGCSQDVLISESERLQTQAMTLQEILSDVLDDAPPNRSPYLELREFFHTCKESPLTLTFKEIEKILGDELNWEAYFYESFWRDEMPDQAWPLWQEEEFPFDTLLLTTPDYCISEAWTSQGYTVKALNLAQERIVFRKINKNISGVTLPKALAEQQLPVEIVYKLNEILKQFVIENGL